MSIVYLKYLGNKDAFPDTIAGTRVIWNGQGDIKPVSEEAAKKILSAFINPQFEVVDAKEALAAAPLELEPPIEDFDDSEHQDLFEDEAPEQPVEPEPKPAAKAKAKK